MNVLDVAVEVIDALNTLNAGYMLVGSLATNLYGIPRNTNDADFVLSPQITDPVSVSTLLGTAYRLDNQMSFESVTLTSRRVLTHTETGFLIEFFELSEDPHDLMRFSRRVHIEFLNRPAFVPTVEDVIITKLRWAVTGKRAKDALDVRSVLAVQRTSDIDAVYLRRWTDVHGTTKLLDQLLADTKHV